mmetsp:Transcript_9740/g.36250  ORF Transcript_9740/g.36250 Transcript_9740/m.36250 type:complete len:208 (+) Transcript_9740:210-833(+)
MEAMITLQLANLLSYDKIAETNAAISTVCRELLLNVGEDELRRVLFNRLLRHTTLLFAKHSTNGNEVQQGHHWIHGNPLNRIVIFVRIIGRSSGSSKWKLNHNLEQFECICIVLIVHVVTRILWCSSSRNAQHGSGPILFELSCIFSQVGQDASFLGHLCSNDFHSFSSCSHCLVDSLLLLLQTSNVCTQLWNSHFQISCSCLVINP